MNAVDFIKQKYNHHNILKAIEQQKDIEYFTLSCLQEDITESYIKAWVNRKYATNVKFLNWVKTIFKTDNFLSFYKYLRHPLPSAQLINDDIYPQLRRVFHADDAFFRHTVRGKNETCHELNSDSFDKELFDAILFNHNSIVIEDINVEEKRYREIISIKNIIAVDCDKEKINRVAYRSCLELENGDEVRGYTYIDDKQYIFFDLEYNVLKESTHDLEECPADWVTFRNMFIDNNVVKKSIFSYALVDLEEYVFLKTLQKMTEPNGAIPVTTMLKTDDKKADGNFKKALTDKEPFSSASFSAANPYTINPISSSDSQIQAGTIVKIPVEPDVNGNVNMEVIKNYFQFHYIPTGALEYLNDRIKEIEDKIKASLIGDYKEGNDTAKNEMQVKKGKDNKADNLRWLSEELSRIKQLSDFKTLALIHGKENVNVEAFFGTDFFLDSIDDLYDSFKKAPNSIERRKILKRISQTKNKNNTQQANRDKILYSIIPYPSDQDFNTAMQRGDQMDSFVFDLQTRFDYWISRFEAEYGQIDEFYEGLGEIKESAKIITINNLIKNIINNESTVKT